MATSLLELGLNEDQGMIRSAVLEFALEQIVPRVEALEHEGAFDTSIFERLASLGLCGIFAPADRGGAGAGFLAHVAVLETLAESSGSVAASLLAHGIGVEALLRTEAPVAADLEAALSGAMLLAPALMEDDPSQTLCEASAESGEVKLRGQKVIVPFLGNAGAYLVAARFGATPLLVLCRPGHSVRHGPRAKTLGLASLPSGPLLLDDAPGIVLGSGELLGQLLSNARLGVSAVLAGVARGALSAAVRYAEERKQFGHPLKAFGAIQERLARSDARVEALVGLLVAGARLWDREEDPTTVAGRARLFASEVALAATDDAVQVYGGYGLSREYPVERAYRDARFLGFGEHVPSRSYQALAEALED